MRALRDLLRHTAAASVLGLPLAAYPQVADSFSSAWKAGWPTQSRNAIGLQLSRSQPSLPCGATALICESGAPAARLHAGAMVGRYWGVELGYVESGRVAAREGRAQGLNLSLVGKAPLGQSLGVFGRLGTTYGRSDTSVLGARPAPVSEPGFGLSYGAGVSFAFTPRLSATLEWDSNDFRFPGSGREPVRSTSLGLRYRY